MKQHIEEDILIKNYLLGNLQQEEKLQIEERLFFDEKYFQTLQAVEDDLIDDYIYEELSPNERNRFENYFLSTPERHESLRVAKALKIYISKSAVSVMPHEAGKRALLQRLSSLPFLRSRNLLWKAPLVFTTLLLVLGVFWLLMWAVRAPKRNSPVQEAQQSPLPGENKDSLQGGDEQRAFDTNSNPEPQPKQEQYAEQQNRESSRPAPEHKERKDQRPKGASIQNSSPNSQPRHPTTAVYAFMLIPGGPTRGNENFNEVKVPVNAAMIKLQLPLVEDTDYRNFQAILISDDDKVIRRWSGLNSTDSKAGKVVSISVQAHLLSQLKYHIKLSGLSLDDDPKEIHTYYFRVAEK
ncbi:MAG: hypothetical protein QOD00_3679 [Blastocatellia bacterium]|nr:hypothetical protein [Blastocatellia bacterium]